MSLTRLRGWSDKALSHIASLLLLSGRTLYSDFPRGDGSLTLIVDMVFGLYSGSIMVSVPNTAAQHAIALDFCVATAISFADFRRYSPMARPNPPTRPAT